jgi:hypothetical protein
MHFGEFVDRMKQIKNRGFVRTHRSGDTGIGKTLEDHIRVNTYMDRTLCRLS